MMSEQRFIRNIQGDIYDNENDKWIEEDWKGKPLDYDDEVVRLLNEQQATIQHLEKENEKLRQQNRKLYKCALYGKTIGDEL